MSHPPLKTRHFLSKWGQGQGQGHEKYEINENARSRELDEIETSGRRHLKAIKVTKLFGQGRPSKGQ